MRINCSQQVIVNHLEKEMASIPLDQLPKIFKVSLSVYFSKWMDQEYPEDKDLAISLFPSRFQRLLSKRWLKPKRKVRELWNLLQSKRLCNPVPKEMIRKAYEKHGNLLSTVGKTPEAILSTLKSVSRQFAERVRFHYDERISLAPSKAYFGVKRSDGGCFSKLKSNYSANKSRGNPLVEGTRIDPPLIYLKGPPGVGKSFLSNMIVKRLSERFGEINSCYWRNFATDHCDDYSRQLIFGIDDAFQVKDSINAPDGIVDEIIQMKSNNPFILPMADLKFKGTKFNSEFILLSSNTAPDEVVSATVHIRSKQALLRRMNEYWEIRSRTNGLYRVSYRKIADLRQGLSYPSHNQQEFYVECSAERLVSLIIEKAIEQHTLAVNSCLASIERSQKWRIPIVPYSGKGPSLAYEFPDILPMENIVEAHAIPEPLKVRMITKEQPISYALKPLQIAMSKALKDFGCFFPGYRGDLQDFINKNLEGQRGFLLSGDYSAATDNLNSDVMLTCLNEIKKSFPTHSELRKYIDFFGGQHKIIYPKWTGVPDVIQRRGQLMGSLLSFPILCLANASTLCHLRHQDLSDLKACVNGDDILFVDDDRKIKSWKRIATALGLVPSIGKNFQSNFFGTFNSQLFFRNKKSRNLVYIPTGKCGLIVRKDRVMVDQALKAGFSKGQIVSFGKSALKSDPSSIDIPCEFGGCGISFDKKPSRDDRLIYLFKLSSLLKNSPKPIPIDDGTRFVVRVPHYLFRKFKSFLKDNDPMVRDLRTFAQSQEDNLLREIDQSFQWNSFRGFRTSAKKQKTLREFLDHGDLESSAPLTAFKPVWVTVDAGDISFVKNQSDRLMRNYLLKREKRVDKLGEDPCAPIRRE